MVRPKWCAAVHAPTASCSVRQGGRERTNEWLVLASMLNSNRHLGTSIVMHHDCIVQDGVSICMALARPMGVSCLRNWISMAGVANSLLFSFC
jgi:hypothetical protein